MSAPVPALLSGLSAAFFGAGLLLLGCPADPDPTPDGPTWHQDVAPIFAKYCWDCHTEFNFGGFSLATYDEAKVLATWVGNTMRAGDMPPFRAKDTADCVPEHGFKHAPELTEAEIRIIQDWARAETPEGDPATATPLPDPISRELPDPDDSLMAPSPVSVGEDQQGYRCFLLPDAVPEDRWLESAQVVPDALELLHHVSMFAVPAADAAEYEARQGAEDTFECFGLVPWDALEPMFLWLPDSKPLELPPDTGLKVEAGSRLLVQVHYHAWQVGGTDQSTLQVNWFDAPPAHEAVVRVLGNRHPDATIANPPFQIPANSVHSETVRVPIDDGPWRVYGISGRANYAGVGFQAKVGDQCLLAEPDFNIDWLRMYLYAAPIDELPLLEPGDTVEIRCDYDNGWGNRPLRKLYEENGLDDVVTMEAGPGELDETCAAIVGLVAP